MNCPAVVTIPQVVTRKIAVGFLIPCKGGRVGTPSSRMPSNPFVCAEPNSRQIRCLSPHCPGILHFDYEGYRTRWKVWGFPNSPHHHHHPPIPTPKHSHFLSPTCRQTSSHSFFLLCFFDNAILKALCLVIPLCEHVNDDLLQKKVKYVKDHSLFWKNLHLSFWH